MRNQRAVFGSVLFAVSKAELHDTLYTKALGLQLFPDYGLRHLFVEIFNQQMYITILREKV
jgi:hypothetical protein